MIGEPRQIITVIDSCYDNLADCFVDGISEQNRAAVREAYIAYLHERYDHLFMQFEESVQERVAEVCKEGEEATTICLDEKGKMALLFPDEHYALLEKLSLRIAELAKTKKAGHVPRFEKTEEGYAEELKRLAGLVQPAFKRAADRMLSEALVDLVYLFEDNSVQSLRSAAY